MRFISNKLPRVSAIPGLSFAYSADRLDGFARFAICRCHDSNIRHYGAYLVFWMRFVTAALVITACGEQECKRPLDRRHHVRSGGVRSTNITISSSSLFLLLSLSLVLDAHTL